MHTFGGDFIQALLIILIGGIGGYMAIKYQWPSPPFLSGMVFIFIALILILLLVDDDEEKEARKNKF